MTVLSGNPANIPVLDGRLLPLPDNFWVVVPAYNERGRIRAVLDELLALTPNVVVVDDASADDTAGEVLTRPVWLLTHFTNLGQGAALQTGIRYALSRGAEYLATFDADGQHLASEIPSMVQALVSRGADFALGSRFLGRAEQIPALRRLMLRLAVVFTRVVSGVFLTDTHNGIRVMTRRGAEKLHITLNRMEHASEIIDQVAASGLSYIEVPVTVRYTSDSLAKGQKTSAALKLGLKLLLEKVCR